MATFSQLQNDLLDTMDNRTSAFIAIRGKLINNAIRDIERRRFWSCMGKYSSFSTIAGQEEYQVSTYAPRYIASDVMRRVETDGDVPLVRDGDWSEFQRRKLDGTADSGTPLVYIVHTGSTISTGLQSIYFFPTPNAIFSMKFWYHQMLPDLVMDADTNWFTEFMPDVVLYRACLLASAFLNRNPQAWAALFEQTYAEAEKLDAHEKLHKVEIIRRRAMDSEVD